MLGHEYSPLIQIGPMCTLIPSFRGHMRNYTRHKTKSRMEPSFSSNVEEMFNCVKFKDGGKLTRMLCGGTLLNKTERRHLFTICFYAYQSNNTARLYEVKG